MNKISEEIKALAESIIELHKNLGFKGVIKYTIVVLSIVLLFNFRTVVRELTYFIDDIVQTVHDKKLEQRDELLFELPPLLTELRAMTGADRLLYIEFHNSKENLVGIPFKYLDLVLTSKNYGIPEFDIKRYHELNAGILSPIFPELRKAGYVINHGSSDTKFLRDYHAVSDFINAQDGSVQQVYLNLPGVNTPIGIIILEWLDENEERNWSRVIEISRDYVARINGLVLSKSGI